MQQNVEPAADQRLREMNHACPEMAIAARAGAASSALLRHNTIALILSAHADASQRDSAVADRRGEPSALRAAGRRRKQLVIISRP